MELVRILLIHPECQSTAIGFRLAAMPEPLGLELIAGSVTGHELRILDLRISGAPSNPGQPPPSAGTPGACETLLGVLAEFRPDMVAVTALTPEVYAAQEVLATVKKFSPEIFTVAGGHHASLMSEDFQLPCVDAIVLGEGEIAFPPLVEAVASGRSPSAMHKVPNLLWRDASGHFVKNAIAADLDMDMLAVPRRDLTARYRNDYFFLFDKPDTSVATGRGCPYRCNFCSVWEFYGGRTRQMCPRRVMEEVKAVQTDHMTFVDDNFLMNNKRERAIADMIKAEGIKKRYSMECRTDSIARHPELVEQWVKVGLYAVLLGLEGASDKALTSVNKGNTSKINDEAIKILHANGVIIWGAFIVDPDWVEDDFKELRDYVTAKDITHTQFTVITPLPGTELYKQKFNDLLTYDYDCFDTLHAVTATRLPREEFYQHFANLYHQTNIGPYYDLVREGKLTIKDVKYGKMMLETMTRWQDYVSKDPVLGKARDKSYIPPGAMKFAAR
jgi:radical SAM superfamily enzyme YgiQ (UPF0313 family)